MAATEKRKDIDDPRKASVISSRAIGNLSSKMPRIPNHTNHHKNGFPRSSTIDLSKSDNFLLRDELIAICKAAINDELVTKHFSTPENQSGDPALLESLARLFNMYFNPCVPVKPSHIASAPGAAGCLDALLHTICEPGDGVLIPGPYWNEFDIGTRSRAIVQPIMVSVAGFCDTYRGFLKSLANAMDTAPCPVKALILTNLHSPFGQCYPQEVLEGCLKFCQERRIHFISDEVYALTAFSCAEISDPVQFVPAMSLDTRALGCDLSRVHTVWSMSKDFGASGFRVGCTVSQANKELINGLTIAPNTQISSLSTIFATALLSSPRLPFLISLNSARLAESYMLITSFFVRHGIKYIPVNAGLNIFARLAPWARTWEDEDEMVRKIRDVGITVCAGGNYHRMPKEKGWARLSFSVGHEVLLEALQRIELALELG
ncbi:hypothetical protein FQN57_004822 [Myotisia sp. PD_48]|nr:hypothetical protein FQN57_004822 [Myotisia sp. PD_48]